jgi:hypothetical protein
VEHAPGCNVQGIQRDSSDLQTLSDEIEIRPGFGVKDHTFLFDDRWYGVLRYSRV